MDEGIRSRIVVGEIIKEIKKPNARKIIYKNRDQFAPRSIKIPDTMAINIPTYDMRNCAEMGMGLLAISSCAIGLLVAMALVSKDSPLVTSRIQAITATDQSRFLLSGYLAPNGSGSAACRCFWRWVGWNRRVRHSMRHRPSCSGGVLGPATQTSPRPRLPIRKYPAT